MLLIMKVKSFSLLVSMRIKKCGIQIQQNHFRSFDEIYNLAESSHQSTKLIQGILVHAVKKQDKVG